MKESTFTVTLYSPLGHRFGVLSLQEQESCVLGTLEILGHIHQVEGNVATKNDYTLTSMLETVMERLPCKIVCTVNCGELSGTVDTEKGCWKLTGKPMKEELL